MIEPTQVLFSYHRCEMMEEDYVDPGMETRVQGGREKSKGVAAPFSSLTCCFPSLILRSRIILWMN